MTARRTTAARSRKLKAMGRDLGSLHFALSNELVWLNWEWAQFVQLYAEKRSRLELMNETAPVFFSIIQRVLWQNALLSLARLSGPPKSAGKDNLSIQRLCGAVSDPTLRRKVERLTSRAVKLARFAITWRNKHLAHRDLNRAVGRRAGRLPRANQQKVEAALAALAEVLNLIESHYEGSATLYTPTFVAWGAESLLTVLRDGRIREQLRAKRLEAGEINPEDWNDHLPAV